MDRLAAPPLHSSLPGRSPFCYGRAGSRRRRRRDVARLRIRHAGRHQGGLGRVPGRASDRLLRRPCARPTRQALGRARGSAGRGAGPGGFDAVAARIRVAGQAIGVTPCRQSARASEAKAGEGDGLGRRQPEPLVIVVRLQLCQAGRDSRHRGRARQWRRADRFRQEVVRRLRSPRSCCRPPASILRKPASMTRRLRQGARWGAASRLQSLMPCLVLASFSAASLARRSSFSRAVLLRAARASASYGVVTFLPFQVAFSDLRN